MTDTENASDFPIAAHVRLKHNILAEALEKRGWSQNDAARFLGIGLGRFGRWVNMKSVPRELTDELVLKLYELTGETPDCLWPKEVFTPEFLATPRALRIMRKVPVHLLATWGIVRNLPPTPEEDFEHEELRGFIQKALNSLKGNEKRVLSMRYLEDKTARDVAKSMKLSPARIHQIEQRAIRTLSHPKYRRLRAVARVSG